MKYLFILESEQELVYLGTFRYLKQLCHCLFDSPAPLVFLFQYDIGHDVPQVYERKS